MAEVPYQSGIEGLRFLSSTPSRRRIGGVRVGGYSCYPPVGRMDGVELVKGVSKEAHRLAATPPLDDGEPGRVVIHEEDGSPSPKFGGKHAPNADHGIKLDLADDVLPHFAHPPLYDGVWDGAFPHQALAGQDIESVGSYACTARFPCTIREDKEGSFLLAKMDLLWPCTCKQG